MTITLSENHVYTDSDTGRVYPSVTQIIKDAGMMGFLPSDPWYMERGTAVHEATALFDQGRLDYDALDPRIRGYVDAWALFTVDTDFGPAFIETSFVHTEYGYAGTLDRNGLDIKTGAYCPWHALQAAAYARLSGEECKIWRTVYLSDDGRYVLRVYSVRELWAAWNVFLAALSIYNWKKGNGIK